MVIHAAIGLPKGRAAQAFTYAIERSCINKAEVVAADEREGGVRATLNLGHTFGHAIENVAGYGAPSQFCQLSQQHSSLLIQCHQPPRIRVRGRACGHSFNMVHAGLIRK